MNFLTHLHIKAFSMVTKSSDPFNKIIVNLFASSVGKSEWCVFGAIKSVWQPVAQSFVQHNGGIQVENEEWFLWLCRRQILTYKDGPRAERVNPCPAEHVELSA